MHPTPACDGSAVLGCHVSGAGGQPTSSSALPVQGGVQLWMVVRGSPLDASVIPAELSAADVNRAVVTIAYTPQSADAGAE